MEPVSPKRGLGEGEGIEAWAIRDDRVRRHMLDLQAAAPDFRRARAPTVISSGDER